MPNNRKRRFNDNTFFILSALKYKDNRLNIIKLSFVYKYESFLTVLSELRQIRDCFDEFNVTLYHNGKGDEDIERRLNYLGTTLEQIALQFNNKSLEDSPYIDMNDLKEFFGCEIELKQNKKATFLDNLMNYSEGMPQGKGIYPSSEHYEKVKQYFDGKGKLLLFDPKTKLSRYTKLIEDFDEDNTRYNFFHYFQELENNEDIKIRNMLIDEEEPTIDFKFINANKFLKKKFKQSKFIKNYNGIELYNNKVQFESSVVEIDRPYKFRLLHHCLKNPNTILSRTQLSKITHCKQDIATTCTSAVNRLVQKLLKNDDFFIIELHNNNENFAVKNVEDIPYKNKIQHVE